MNLPSTRKEAQLIQSKHFFTGVPCKHGHISKRFTSTKQCCECLSQRSKRADVKAKAKTYPSNQPDAQAKRNARWKSENTDKYLEYQRQYRRDNRGKMNSHSKNYKELKNGWVLSSIEKMMVENLYEDCRRISQETGVPHHIDHIIPLSKGGPHHPWNLRIITAEENLRKSNKL